MVEEKTIKGGMSKDVADAAAKELGGVARRERVKANADDKIEQKPLERITLSEISPRDIVFIRNTLSEIESFISQGKLDKALSKLNSLTKTFCNLKMPLRAAKTSESSFEICIKLIDTLFSETFYLEPLGVTYIESTKDLILETVRLLEESGEEDKAKTISDKFNDMLSQRLDAKINFIFNKIQGKL